jgi:hypothetical protein
MSPDTSIRGSARQVALVVLFAVVVTVAGVAPAVAGSPSAESGSVYQISGMDVPSSVTPDESFSVSAQLSNAGSIDMQVVAFRVDTNGDGEFTPNESLGAEAFVLLEGSSRNVSFDVSTAGIEPGEYEYMLWTESSSTTGNITVESPVAPATFLLAGAAGPESVTPGEEFTVSASVANVGDLNGTETLSLYLDTDGNEVLSDETALTNTTFELASASNGTVNLTATAPDLEPGEYAIGVGTSTELVTGTVTVEESPAPFEVVSLRSDRAVVGGTLSVSTILKNAADEERTGTVELRLDTNGDGEFAPGETVRTREVTLGAGASKTHGFAVTVPSSYDPGEYEIALVTPTNERVDTFEVFRQTSSSSSADSDSSDAGESDEPDATTREDVAQALYGASYDDLDDGQKFAVEDVYTRLPGEIPLSEMETRQQISQRLYGVDFLVDSQFQEDAGEYALSKEEAATVQDTYDAQFAPLPGSGAEYSLNEVAIGLFGASYDDLQAFDIYQVHAVYNRQPYVDSLEFNSGVGVADPSVTDVIRTQRRIAQVSYDGVYVHGWQTLDSEANLDTTRLLAVHETWEEQFEEN